MSQDYLTKSDEEGLKRFQKEELIRLWRKKRHFPGNEAIYRMNDFNTLMPFYFPESAVNLETMEEILKRDEQREKDGFSRKIIVVPRTVPGTNDQFILVPKAAEEKLVHDVFEPETEGGGLGSGEGEEGDIVGEDPINPEQGPGEGDGGPGEGSGGERGLETKAYELGQKLMEEFDLPNLKDKGKKVPVDKWKYDLTDIFKGAGQLLDKKRTLLAILKTNLGLGILDPNNIDPTKFIISSSDNVFRVLSKEREYQSQAMVFFLRDYSGSMAGKPTEVVCTQHLFIYAWLLVQFGPKLVIPRFILHDSKAKEVADFDTYYRSQIAGGTKVASAYRKVIEIVEEENLAQNYNIYVFHGTDGDDWDEDGKETIPKIEKIMSFVSRMGITIARNAYAGSGDTKVEKYIKKSGLLEANKELLRMNALVAGEADQSMILKSINDLVSE